MKRLATLLTVAGLFATSAAFGQGFITANGDAATTVSTNAAVDINGAPTGFAGQGVIQKTANQYFYTLLTKPYLGTLDAAPGIGQANLNGWLTTGRYVANSTAFTGRFALGTDVAVNNWPVGQDNQFIIVGWSANLAGDNSTGSNHWASVDAMIRSGNFALGAGSSIGFLGFSAVGHAISAAAPPALPPSLFGASGVVTVGFGLNAVVVPEPATFTLAGLGAAAMFILRRRR